MRWRSREQDGETFLTESKLHELKGSYDPKYMYKRGDVDVVLTGSDMHESKPYRERVRRLTRRTGGRLLSTALRRTHTYYIFFLSSTALPTCGKKHTST